MRIKINLFEQFHCIACGELTPTLQSHQIALRSVDRFATFKNLCPACFRELQDIHHPKNPEFRPVQ